VVAQYEYEFRIAENEEVDNYKNTNDESLNLKGELMEPKSKTLIERMGFLDSDRRRYSHDEIQIWVYKNFRSIIKKTFPMVEYENIKPVEIKLEYPITDNRRNFVVALWMFFTRNTQ
jgi:hypothetical protein